jgi:hypothetical protein
VVVNSLNFNKFNNENNYDTGSDTSSIINRRCHVCLENDKEDDFVKLPCDCKCNICFECYCKLEEKKCLFCKRKIDNYNQQKNSNTTNTKDQDFNPQRNRTIISAFHIDDIKCMNEFFFGDGIYCCYDPEVCYFKSCKCRKCNIVTLIIFAIIFGILLALNISFIVYSSICVGEYSSLIFMGVNIFLSIIYWISLCIAPRKIFLVYSVSLYLSIIIQIILSNGCNEAKGDLIIKLLFLMCLILINSICITCQIFVCKDNNDEDDNDEDENEN